MYNQPASRRVTFRDAKSGGASQGVRWALNNYFNGFNLMDKVAPLRKTSHLELEALNCHNSVNVLNATELHILKIVKRIYLIFCMAASIHIHLCV